MKRKTAILACPSCHAMKTRLLGTIPPSNTFAGRILDREIPGECLWQCLDCHLLFRYPRPSIEALKKLYQFGNINSWSIPLTLRTDWHLIRAWLKARKVGKLVLDVGAFDGRLLEFLGRDYTWLGVEIQEEAIRRARARGVNVVCNDFTKLSELNITADIALAVDVIEHTVDPKIFLTSLTACVRPGGYIIVSTGNTEAFSWRLMGSRYWYCHIAEHLSFINPSWAHAVSSQLGLEIEYLRFFSHSGEKPSIKQKIYETVGNVLLRFTPTLFSLLRRVGAGCIDLARYPGLALAPPYWMSAKDHMLVVFKKGSAA